MRFLSFVRGGVPGLGVLSGAREIRGLPTTDDGYSDSLGHIIGDSEALDAAATRPHFVTADELPPGVVRLPLETVLNRAVVQSASTDEIFNAEERIEVISATMTLEAGDVIVSGTASRVGQARNPPLYMAEGDRCEVRIEGVGILSNPILREAALAA